MEGKGSLLFFFSLSLYSSWCLKVCMDGSILIRCMYVVSVCVCSMSMYVCICIRELTNTHISSTCLYIC